jgi:hypothetical protein
MQIKKCITGIILFVVSAISITPCFSQENFLPGYLVRNNGDTVSGFIDYRNWERNPDIISFREKSPATTIQYTPGRIKGFGVLDEIYESATIETEMSPDNTTSLLFKPELKIQTDSTFLQVMIRGEKSLYFYMNRLGKEQFYIKQGSTYELLIYKRYFKDQDGENVIAENRRYIGQLQLYLNDCPSVKTKLENMDYRKKSMENLFLAYIKCTGSKIQFQKKTEKLRTEIGILAGLSLTTLKFTSEYYTLLVDAGYPQSVNFTGGIFFDVVLPRNMSKWSLCNELTFSTYKVTSHYDEILNSNQFTKIESTFGYSYIKMNNMLRFKYPIGDWFIYLNGGISNGYAIAEKNYMKLDTKNFSPEKIEEGKALEETRKFEFGLLLGLGTKYKRFSFEIRREWGNGMSIYTSLKSSTGRYHFLLGFRF